MNKKIITIIVAVSFAAGILFAGAGYLVFGRSEDLLHKIVVKLKEKRIAMIPKAKIPLVLSDFENENDLKKWKTRSAALELSPEHASEGKSSAKITFHKAECPVLEMEDFLEKNRESANWAKYEIISFDIFNPYDTKEKVGLQIKDRKGRRHKQDLALMPLKSNHFDIGIASLQSEIDIISIGQFSLYLWAPESDKTFYIDDVKLLPSSAFKKRAKPINSPEFLPASMADAYKTGDYFDFSKNRDAWLKKDSATGASYIEVPLSIMNEARSGLESFPMFGGIPFGRGELKSDDNLMVVDAEGKEVPIQTKVLCRWPDKSIKWLLVDMEGSFTGKYYLRYSPDIKLRSINTNLNVKQESNSLSVTTGPLKFSIDKKSFRLFDKVWLDTNKDGIFSDAEIISQGGDLVLVHAGKEYRSSLDKDYKFIVEEKGPLMVGLKASGWFTSSKGEKFCQFIIRIKAFKDKSYVKIDHTFIYTGYPENKYHYIYKGKRLPKNETIDAIYIETPFKLNGDLNVAFEADNEIYDAKLQEPLDFYQKSADTFFVNEKGKNIVEGSRMQGWVDLSAQDKGLTVYVKDCWQQYPKGYSIDSKNKSIITQLWPKIAGELDFKTTQAANDGVTAIARGSAFGVAKTHDIVFYFHEGGYKEADSLDVTRGFSEEALIMPKSQWFADTLALGRLSAKSSLNQPAEESLDMIFDWADRQKHDFKWYGMVDFGDTLSWYRDSDGEFSYDEWGWHPVGRWGWFNVEAASTHTGSLLQYLRTGEYKYFRFGRDLARHIMDIDTCHYNTVANDKRLKKKIYEVYSQPGSMHRHNADHWGDRNDETSHTNLTGLLLYYYITGDDRARDVLDEVGSFFLKEPITYFGHPDSAPQRSVANALWGDVLMYELTSDERYKRAADRLANIFYIGQLSDGSWVEWYDPVADNWRGEPDNSFIANYTLYALIEYHKLTGNKAIADCIVKATDYLSQNEEYIALFHCLAYSYWLTSDKRFIDEGVKRLNSAMGSQRRDAGPRWNGMIYQKAYYPRPSEFLYSIPWLLGVTEEKGKERS